MNFEINNFETMQTAISTFCRFLIERGLPPERIFDSKLVASELLSNVLKHSNGVARLKGEINEDFIEISVWSSTAFVPPKVSHCSDIYAENGRGLFLIDHICEKRTTKNGEIIVQIRIR